ncbi:Transcriptional regulatory protein DOT6 [Nakaseomyces glabratus]|uniref:Transcriptional regulatory protein DOT6 n=1 Tax=Candida glabrata TaxID=5478 RepID=A0A0W0CN36_CANGB|nr:Transcriptional regulatory protein DOT6 [Nakaseomyces glabratus]KTB01031.1 Transcriptional regulatory protein DOT6 [Nakaseomyces glabratus]
MISALMMDVGEKHGESESESDGIKNLGWKEIALYFENRTPNACQFRWRRLKSGNLKSNKTATVDISEYNVVVKRLSEIENAQLSRSASEQPFRPPVDNNDKLANNIPVSYPGSANGNGTPLGSEMDTKLNKVVSGASPAPVAATAMLTSSSHGSVTPNGTNGTQKGKRASLHFPIIPLSRRTSVATIPSNAISGSTQSITGSVTPGSTQRSHTSLAKNKFPKARSYSHTLGPSPQLHSLKGIKFKETKTRESHGSAINDDIENENFGFIPKIIVKSRRNSFTHPPMPVGNSTNSSANTKYNPGPSGLSISPPSTFNGGSGGQYLQNASFSSNLANALNTTLITSKSRKNSFSVNSRRSSFNISSTSNSRRPSIISAPNSITNNFVINHSNSASNLHAAPKMQRKNSNVKREATSSQSLNTISSPNGKTSTENGTYENSYNTFKVQYMDNPVGHSSAFQKKAMDYASHSLDGMEPKDEGVTSCSNNSGNNSRFMPWSLEEDQLLTENKLRNLSLMELSILLPNRSENEIKWRLDTFSRNYL